MDKLIPILMITLGVTSLTFFIIENLDYNTPCYIQIEQEEFVQDTSNHHRAYAISELTDDELTIENTKN